MTTNERGPQTNVPHKTETITFHSGDFKLVAELKLPYNNVIHPLVIMVHGDGPAYRTDYPKIKNVMLRAGHATLMWDKPGSGESTGVFCQERKLAERASILVNAVNVMKKHAAIDSTRIGLWGTSEAGYVMPLALSQTEDIKFVIAVSCPGMNGIDQFAYLIRRQLISGGVPEEKVQQAETHYRKYFLARRYQEYVRHAKSLLEYPTLKQMGFDFTPRKESDWKPCSLDDEYFFNPIKIIETTIIPVLAFFGKRDTQVDPFQGAESYKKALTRAGNQNFRVELIPDADHDIILCETGSLEERRRRSQLEWENFAPDYLKIMEEWLRERGYGSMR